MLRKQERERSRLENYDVFQRADVDYRIQTVPGGIISLVALVIMFWLFISELSFYWSAEIVPDLYVDTSLGQQLQINLDITFHHLPCGFISVNALDKTGNHQLNIHHDIFTTRLDKFGQSIEEKEKEVVGRDDQAVDVDLENPEKFDCGSCYGAETETRKCCNTCEEVQQAYNAKGWGFNDPHRIVQCVQEGFMENLKSQKDEGCRVHGYLSVNRVTGNVNIVPGKLILKNSQYVVDSEIYQLNNIFNLTHTITHVSFGEDYPGMKNPLNGVSKLWIETDGSPMYEYFIQIVPTVYKSSWGSVTNTNQFSVSEYTQKVQHLRGGGVPGLFFMYELSPITVDFKEASRSFLHFLTNLCAIVGGVYTVASLVDSFIYHTMQWRK